MERLRPSRVKAESFKTSIINAKNNGKLKKTAANTIPYEPLSVVIISPVISKSSTILSQMDVPSSFDIVLMFFRISLLIKI